MRKTLLVAMAILGLSCLLNLTPARAQENDEDKFSFGKVVSVAADSVTVKEYDFAKDADVEMSYTLTPETELGNINAVADLKVGDDIVIDYVEKDGKRKVTTLVKEEKGAEAPVNGEAVQAAAEGTAPAAAEPAAPVAPAAPAAAVVPAAPADAPAAAPAEQK
jgi:cytoskeletal protein RodZ